MRKLILLMGLWFGLANAAFGQCGGTERWAVKDGTDSSAAQVDFSRIQPKTILDLVQIPEPALPNDNTTRTLPQEATVVRVTARLIQWKLETDSDYHLVLTDDTENFTPAHGAPTGHSIVGEVPDPNCLAGSTDEFGTQSPFLQIGSTGMGIDVARRQMNEAFPNADLTGQWNDAGGTHVEIVGVTFFDRAHGQVSRAPNNLEIHPIVSIKFLDNTANMLPPSPGHGPGRARPRGVAPATGAPSPAPAVASPLAITDPKTGETATINEDRALVVAPSENSGKVGALRSGVSSADLGYPKTLTVCWFAADGSGKIQLSLDGKSWFDVEPTPGAGCKAMPPARFVKLTANRGMYQVSY
ncbi:MAG TPA: hypothetical protein VJN42_00225 [Candidatus Acidoferrum sp.]|nr:hypothetical protein [Candidatus Acidoferrum sp.]